MKRAIPLSRLKQLEKQDKLCDQANMLYEAIKKNKPKPFTKEDARKLFK